MTAKQKQALLAYLGYDDGPLNGLWSENSKRATMAAMVEEVYESDLTVFEEG